MYDGNQTIMKGINQFVMGWNETDLAANQLQLHEMNLQQKRPDTLWSHIGKKTISLSVIYNRNVFIAVSVQSIYGYVSIVYISFT